MATWIVERTQDRRFPFRITIEQDGRPLLAVRAQSHWPGAGKQIFCLRETELDPAQHLEPFERVRVAHIARLGRKLSVTLDRAQRKRCEFLKIEKPFSSGTALEPTSTSSSARSRPSGPIARAGASSSCPTAASTS